MEKNPTPGDTPTQRRANGVAQLALQNQGLCGVYRCGPVPRICMLPARHAGPHRYPYSSRWSTP